MPNYIRVKQIDPGEFTGAVNTVIESQSFKINVDTATGLVLNNVGGVSISGANIDLVDSSLSISGNLNVGGIIEGNINLAVANVVYLSGNQNISGVKNFYSRPTVNGTGVVLSGETVANALTANFATNATNASFATNATNASNVTNAVYTTGNQIISGFKTFDTEIIAPNLVYITETQVIDGQKSFTNNINFSGSINQNIIFGRPNSADLRTRIVTFTGDYGLTYMGRGGTAPTPHGYAIVFEGGGLGKKGYLTAGPNPSPTGYQFATLDWVNRILSGTWRADEIKIKNANPVLTETDQNISGVKNFISKPTVNGTGILLSGDSASRVNYLTATLTQTGTYNANSGYNNLYLKYNNTSTTEGITRVILPYESGTRGDILNIEWTNEGGVGGRTGDYFIMNRLASDGSLSPNIPLKKDNYISFIRTPGGDNSGYAWHQVGAHETTLSSTINYSRNIFPTKENLYVTGQTISNLFTNTISDGLGRIDILSGQSVLIYGDQANISGRKSFQNLNYVRKTTAYNYVTGNFNFNNFYVNLINATSPRTGILPTPTSGLNYYVKNLNTGVVFLTGISGLKIDTADYLNLYKNESVELLGVNNLGYTGWITMSLNEGLT